MLRIPHCLDNLLYIYPTVVMQIFELLCTQFPPALSALQGAGFPRTALPQATTPTRILMVGVELGIRRLPRDADHPSLSAVEVKS
jgi:hypothetical protein